MPTLSRGKRIVFSLLPVAVLLLALVTAELVVRRTSPSASAPLVVTGTYDGIEWNIVNRSHLKKYFPASSPLIPELKPSLFRAMKLPGALRVFCLGSSSMYGTPYDMTANIPGIVRKQLRHLAPERDIEVVNFGASAINSNVIADLAQEMVEYQPDVVLVYMGHNEFYGPDGVGASWLEKTFPFLTEWKYGLRGLRLVELLQDWLRTTKAHDASDRNLMREVSQGSLVALDSPDARRVCEMYERNVRDIIRTFRQRGVPVILSEISSNLTFPPFVSDSVASVLAWPAFRDSMESLLEGGEYSEALRRVEALDSSGRGSAIVHYWKGRALQGLGRHAEAKIEFESARDLDLLKFRAPGEINVRLRKIARAEGIPLIASDSLLASISPGGIPGDNVFWEHLHPMASGYYEIAGMFVAEIRSMGLLGPVAPSAPLLPFVADTLGICWLDLAYADLAIQHLTGRWPFERYTREPAVLTSSDKALVRIARDVYARTMRWDEGAYRTASYFWSQGKFREARTTYQALLDEYPYNFYPNYLMGSLLNQQGDREGALKFYRRSIASNPGFPRSRLDLGLIMVNEGKFQDAVTDLNAVLAMPDAAGMNDIRAVAHYGLAAAKANLGDLKSALAEVERSLALAPRSPDALALRAKLQSALR
jgi:tetratricopeptide (TPR) repeat protein/lysophospholipase L1-like esterase